MAPVIIRACVRTHVGAQLTAGGLSSLSFVHGVQLHPASPTSTQTQLNSQNTLRAFRSLLQTQVVNATRYPPMPDQRPEAQRHRVGYPRKHQHLHFGSWPGKALLGDVFLYVEAFLFAKGSQKRVESSGGRFHQGTLGTQKGASGCRFHLGLGHLSCTKWSSRRQRGDPRPKMRQM